MKKRFLVGKSKSAESVFSARSKNERMS